MNIPSEIELNIRRVASFKGCIDIYLPQIEEWFKANGILDNKDMKKKLHSLDNPGSAQKLISDIKKL